MLLEIAALSAGCFSLRREFYARKKIKQDHENADSRVHKDETLIPCATCDASTLRYLNSISHSTSCVTIETSMPRCCHRCAPTCCVPIKPVQDIEKMINIFTIPEIQVRVHVPASTYGTVQRAYEASAIATKGSDLRAHGTLVSHLSLLSSADEFYKISLMRWLPYLMMRSLKGTASLKLPDADSGFPTQTGMIRPEEYADATRMPKRSHCDPRARGLLRRLRKLRDDEKLSDRGRKLLRKCKKEALNDACELISANKTTDIFSLNLVELKNDDGLMPYYEASCSEDSSSDLSSPRSAAVDPDEETSGIDDLPPLDPIEEAINGDQEGLAGDDENEDDVLVGGGQIPISVFLRYRHGEQADLGYSVAVPRLARRALRRRNA